MISAKKNKLGRMLGLLAMALFVLLLCLIGISSPPWQSHAADEKYTGVLEDLYRAPDFDKTHYTGASEQKVQLIQIAVGVDHELFVYTYEPGFDYTFSDIVFNTESDFEKIDFRSYKLQCVDNSEGFFKYVVRDYKVPERTHSYAISKLFYPVQNAVEDNNKVTYNYIPVEQIFTVTVTNGVYTYSSEVLKTITVTDKYVGYARRAETSISGDVKTLTSCYYIAFNTDLLMENLLEAQIEYWEDRYDPMGRLLEAHDPNSSPTNVTISSDQSGDFVHDVDSEWWFFSWKTGEVHRTFKFISKPEVFKSETGFTVPNAKDGNPYDWVVNFKFDKREYGGLGIKPGAYSAPADASILRLKFETNGVTYNLGVLDNRSSYVPDAPTVSTASFGGWPWWVYVVLAIGAIALIIALPFIVKLIMFFVEWIVDLIAG